MERLFFSGFAAAAACIVFGGFARTFYLRPLTGAPPLSPLVFAHGVVFTLWMLLLVAQTMLVSAGRLRVHRRLGAVGGVLAAIMVVVGFATAVAGARRGFIPGANAGIPDPLAGLALSLRDLFAFGAFVAAGIWTRHKRETHKRLMVLATVNLLPAAIGRLPMHPVLIGPTTVAFIAAGPLYDRVIAGRAHPVWFWGGWLTVLSMLASFPIGRTEAWQRFAGWLVG
jgi:hypothetical protein